MNTFEFNTDTNAYPDYQKHTTLVEDLKGFYANDSLKQLEKNYETAFGKKPSKEDMKEALCFIELFFAEIKTTCHGTPVSKAADTLSTLIDLDNDKETAKNISLYRTD